MRYKKFKNAEIEVSQLAVGTWAIGGQNYGKVDKNEAICAIRRMIENGVNLILSLIHISSPRDTERYRMPSSA